MHHTPRSTPTIDWKRVKGNSYIPEKTIHTSGSTTVTRQKKKEGRRRWSWNRRSWENLRQVVGRLVYLGQKAWWSSFCTLNLRPYGIGTKSPDWWLQKSKFTQFSTGASQAAKHFKQSSWGLILPEQLVQSLQMTPSSHPSSPVVQFFNIYCPAGHRTASQEQELWHQLVIFRQRSLGIGWSHWLVSYLLYRARTLQRRWSQSLISAADMQRLPENRT